MIAGVVLAAGRGERFGSDKLLRALGGQPLICRTVANCVTSSLSRILVVVGDDRGQVATAVRATFFEDPRVLIVENPDAGRGHLTSVKAGLRAIAPGTRAAAIVLGDMPLVGASITDRLIETHRRTGGFVVPLCDGVWRHPRVIPSAHFGDFLSLDDAAGGGVVFERFRDEVETVEVGEDWHFLDIDTADDLARAERLLRA